MGRTANKRPVLVVLYAVVIGILLSSYISPLQQILEKRAEIRELKDGISSLKQENAEKRDSIGELKTKAGIERVAREKYGLAKPEEKVYVVPEGMRGD